MSEEKKSLGERVDEAVQGFLEKVAGKVAEFLAPEPKLVPVKARRPQRRR